MLCVTSGPGVKTLPVFSHREAARRFLRTSPRRFNLFGSGWRTREISEAGVLLAGCPDGIQWIALDPSSEALFGECGAESLAEVIWSLSRVILGSWIVGELQSRDLEKERSNMAARMCDVCGVRPARVTLRRIVPGGQPRIEHLCEIHAAEARGQRSSFEGSNLGGGSLFDDFFSGFLDTSEGGVGGPARRTMSSRGAEQVDITRYFSDSTSALLQRAARRASEWESPNLDAEHLLHAALEDGVVRRVVEEVDADPDQIRAQLEEEAERGGRRPLPRSRPRPSARYWRPTRSRARSGPHTSVRNTCCSR